VKCCDIERRFGVLNDRFDWVANALGLTFVDPNNRIEDGVSLEMDCIRIEEERDGLDKYTLEVVDLMSEDRQGVRNNKFWKMDITERGIPGKRGDHGSKNRRLYVKKLD
jgi:hypothetical protein